MKKILIAIIFLMFLSGGIIIYEEVIKDSDIIDNIIDKKEKKKVKIIDEDSNSRPIAVMINNNHDAWPHAGLAQSYLNYEIIAEGGITRIMALFKDKTDIEKIGSVRSSRPYFLDYVLENDAIYVHWGGSNDAYSDIDVLDIDNIDGMNYEGTYFFRDRSLNKAYEHTGFTSMDKINEGINDLGFNKTTNKDNLLKYSVDEIDLSNIEGSIKADEVIIPYSNYHTTSYKYDEINKVYLRYMSDTPHTDSVTDEQYTAKNIITYKLENYSYDSYGRQVLENIGSGEGYFITNGYATPITWEKSSRSSKTKYYYSTGEEVILNDGNTWIQIEPSNKYLDIISNNIEEVE